MFGVSEQNFTQLDGSADLSLPFIWSRVSGLKRFRDGFDKGTTSNFVQISENLLRGPWKRLDKRSGKAV
jgi:hypothetical protein